MIIRLNKVQSTKEPLSTPPVTSNVSGGGGDFDAFEESIKKDIEERNKYIVVESSSSPTEKIKIREKKPLKRGIYIKKKYLYSVMSEDPFQRRKREELTKSKSSDDVYHQEESWDDDGWDVPQKKSQKEEEYPRYNKFVGISSKDYGKNGAMVKKNITIDFISYHLKIWND